MTRRYMTAVAITMPAVSGPSSPAPSRWAKDAVTAVEE